MAKIQAYLFHFEFNRQKSSNIRNLKLPTVQISPGAFYVKRLYMKLIGYLIRQSLNRNCHSILSLSKMSVNNILLNLEYRYFL